MPQCNYKYLDGTQCKTYPREGERCYRHIRSPQNVPCEATECTNYHHPRYPFCKAHTIKQVERVADVSEDNKDIEEDQEPATKPEKVKPKTIELDTVITSPKATKDAVEELVAEVRKMRANEIEKVDSESSYSSSDDQGRALVSYKRSNSGSSYTYSDSGSAYDSHSDVSIYDEE